MSAEDDTAADVAREDERPRMTNAEWADSLTADDCVALIDRCLVAQDMKGVVAALKLLAIKDPHEAQLILDTINVGLRLRGVR